MKQNARTPKERNGEFLRLSSCDVTKEVEHVHNVDRFRFYVAIKYCLSVLTYRVMDSHRDAVQSVLRAIKCVNGVSLSSF